MICHSARSQNFTRIY